MGGFGGEVGVVGGREGGEVGGRRFTCGVRIFGGLLVRVGCACCVV